MASRADTLSSSSSSSSQYQILWAGVTRAQLFGDLIAQGGDCEGLIFGSWYNQTDTALTDSQEEKAETTTVTIVPYLFLPIDRKSRFFNAEGKVLPEFLNKHASKIISPGIELLGWWRLRVNTSRRMSLRDIAINRSFHEWKRETACTLKKAHIFGLFGYEKLMQNSIHSCTQTFFLQTADERIPRTLKAQTPNITQSSDREYRNIKRIGSMGGSSFEVSVPHQSQAREAVQNVLDRIDEALR
eukprot:jgi/Bigna1/85456/estExt_fgenesh1_pg.C_40126